MGLQSARLLSDISSFAARNGTLKAGLVRMAHQDLSCALVKGLDNMYATLLFATVHAAGREFREDDLVAVGRPVSSHLREHVRITPEKRWYILYLVFEQTFVIFLAVQLFRGCPPAGACTTSHSETDDEHMLLARAAKTHEMTLM